jgi:hypothetical protein
MLFLVIFQTRAAAFNRPRRDAEQRELAVDAEEQQRMELELVWQGSSNRGWSLSSSRLHQIARSELPPSPNRTLNVSSALAFLCLMRRSSPARPPHAAEAVSLPSGYLPPKAECELIASRFLALKRALNSAYFFMVFG